MLNHVAPYRCLLPNVYLSVTDIANPELLVCGRRTRISLDITRFYEEQYQPFSGSALSACPKTVNRGVIDGGGRGRHNLQSGLSDRCDSSTACRLCRLELFHHITHDISRTSCF